MVPSVRAEYNARFTQAAYEALLARIDKDCPGQLEFRIAETPVFMDAALRDRLVAAGEYILDVIGKPGFKEATDAAIPANAQVPNEAPHTHFLAIDYAICEDEAGNLVPKLIELQGFSSLFGFQEYFSQIVPEYVYVPDNYSYLFGGLTAEKYVEMLNKVIKGDHAAEEVILMEIEPERQKTRIDFFCTQQLTGVEPVCLTKVKVDSDGKSLYRIGPDGRKLPIKRIYNRVIFDELEARPDLQTEFDFTKPYDVEWAGHPAWFFRISKYILPMLDHPSVPRTRRLSEWRPDAADLHKYVLKPLYSFAGQGVVYDVKQKDIDAVADPDNFIVQEKVFYAPALKSPVGGIKTEIRLLYLWPDGDVRATLCTNLVRLSQGNMMGVRFNKDFTWVGGNTAYLER